MPQGLPQPPWDGPGWEFVESLSRLLHHRQDMTPTHSLIHSSFTQGTTPSHSFIYPSDGQDPTNSFIHHHMGHNPPLADSFILHMDTTPLIHPSHGTRPPLTHSSVTQGLTPTHSSPVTRDTTPLTHSSPVTQGLTPTHSLITCHMGHDPTDSFIHTSHASLLLQLFRRGIKD